MTSPIVYPVNTVLPQVKPMGGTVPSQSITMQPIPVHMRNLPQDSFTHMSPQYIPLGFKIWPVVGRNEHLLYLQKGKTLNKPMVVQWMTTMPPALEKKASWFVEKNAQKPAKSRFLMAWFTSPVIFNNSKDRVFGCLLDVNYYGIVPYNPQAPEHSGTDVWRA